MKESSGMGNGKMGVLQWKARKRSPTPALPLMTTWPCGEQLTAQGSVYVSVDWRSRATFSCSQEFCDLGFELSSSPNATLRFETCLWVSSSVGARSNLYEYIRTGKHRRILKVRSLEVFKQPWDVFSKTQSGPAHVRAFGSWHCSLRIWVLPVARQKTLKIIGTWHAYVLYVYIRRHVCVYMCMCNCHLNYILSRWLFSDLLQFSSP